MKYTKISLAFFYCILWISSATRRFDPKIVGGTPVTVSQYPFIVSLQRGSGNHFCGGSILRKASPAVILTAAHCALHIDTNIDFVRLYADDVLGGVGSFDSPITNVLVHPNYNPTTLDNDVALLWISEDISTNTDLETVTISPLTLPSAECCAANDPLQAIGYGRDCPTCALTQTLEFLNVVYIDHATCAALLPFVTDSMVCAGAVPAEGVCFGDSGGPLIKQGTNEQIGIASWVVPTCAQGLPDGFGDVGTFYEWIRENLYECVDSCSGLPNGNYQSCQRCSGYVCCSEGYITEMPCPATLVWDDFEKQCVYSSHTCGLPIPEPIKPEIGECVSSCDGVVNGNYQSCNGCNQFVTCSEGMMVERNCATADPPLVWDDHTKRCELEGTSTTCPEMVLDCCACLTVSEPGCAANKPCEDYICSNDAFCCQFEWDGLCVNQANNICNP